MPTLLISVKIMEGRWQLMCFQQHRREHDITFLITALPRRAPRGFSV
jgi:hypothetical protein